MEHHHHEHQVSSLSKAFIAGTLINLAFVIVEGGFGFISHSMGLLSDAGHNLSDTIVGIGLGSILSYKKSSLKAIYIRVQQEHNPCFLGQCLHFAGCNRNDSH